MEGYVGSATGAKGLMQRIGEYVPVNEGRHKSDGNTHENMICQKDANMNIRVLAVFPSSEPGPNASSNAAGRAREEGISQMLQPIRMKKRVLKCSNPDCGRDDLRPKEVYNVVKGLLFMEIMCPACNKWMIQHNGEQRPAEQEEKRKARKIHSKSSPDAWKAKKAEKAKEKQAAKEAAKAEEKKKKAEAAAAAANNSAGGQTTPKTAVADAATTATKKKKKKKKKKNKGGLRAKIEKNKARREERRRLRKEEAVKKAGEADPAAAAEEEEAGGAAAAG
ncbi:hypothetical protein PV08_06811 [Exophiala spinifera]|uniref:Uncharacterized protein n=1 Tax=Exophiala spinifera TaxID=91928 RepID=A0A0D2B5V2_9EURO|nr:uncharacterized protein PV08_06811 [Exophiala spinifera]KIW14030.1 hypothetical protein PV08_06811 [Exophiala spinifera]